MRKDLSEKLRGSGGSAAPGAEEAELQALGPDGGGRRGQGSGSLLGLSFFFL